MTPYALKQHYDLELQHTNGRQPLFLQTSLDKNKQRVVDHIADAIKRKLG